MYALKSKPGICARITHVSGGFAIVSSQHVPADFTHADGVSLAATYSRLMALFVECGCNRLIAELTVTFCQH